MAQTKDVAGNESYVGTKGFLRGYRCKEGASRILRRRDLAPEAGALLDTGLHSEGIVGEDLRECNAGAIRSGQGAWKGRMRAVFWCEGTKWEMRR